jgi:hypothetical protein
MTLKRTNVYLDPPILKALADIAAPQDRSVAWVIRQALVEYVERRGVKVEPETAPPPPAKPKAKRKPKSKPDAWLSGGTI